MRRAVRRPRRPDVEHAQKRQKRGQCPDEKHPFPGVSNDSGFFQMPKVHAGERSGNVADGGEGLQQSKRIRPGDVRHDFRHKRHTHGEFTTDSEAGERTIPTPAFASDPAWSPLLN